MLTWRNVHLFNRSGFHNNIKYTEKKQSCSHFAFPLFFAGINLEKGRFFLDKFAKVNVQSQSHFIIILSHVIMLDFHMDMSWQSLAKEIAIAIAVTFATFLIGLCVGVPVSTLPTQKSKRTTET